MMRGMAVAMMFMSREAMNTAMTRATMTLTSLSEVGYSSSSLALGCVACC